MLRKSLFAPLLIALSGAVMFSSPAARISVAPLAASHTLRVMTYNIHVGFGVDKKLDMVRGPLIIVGDFNDIPAGRAYQLMRYQFGDAWIERRGTEEGLSYPADKPAKRIDYILSRNRSGAGETRRG